MYTDDDTDKYEEDNQVSIKKSGNKIVPLLIVILGICIAVAILIMFASKDTVIPKKKVFQLKEADITLKFKEEYNEPGFTCLDKDNDCSDLVNITNDIVSSTPGEYTVTYTYQDQSLTRKVIVQEPSSYEITINYTVDKTKYTNEDVNISYTISGDTYKESLLPNEIKSTDLTGIIKVSENGVYTIKAYNIRGEEFIKEITIDNIDKEKPTGTCKAVLKLKNTIITVSAKDNIKINKYEYYEKNKLLTSSDSNSFTTKSSTSNNIKVKLLDEAGNTNEITCSIKEEKYLDPIKPKSSENVIFKMETDTLKAYITKKSNYYITRIWVVDAYSQLNKAVSPSYGKELYGPIDLVKKEMDNKKLQNKAILGFNSSGFYLKGVFDASSVAKYSAYDKTTVGTIVINDGKLVRNAYNKAFKQWYIMGINKKNQMVIFEDNVASTSKAIEEKKAWAKTVINSGIRNTFNFAGPVILNGKKLTKFSSSMPDNTNKSLKGLQLICQINENNFVLFTAGVNKAKRETAINEFLSLGCQTATNLDGGGSVALFYKEKNSQTFKKIVYTGRALPEAGYFTE